jgi:hypothetical protein
MPSSVELVLGVKGFSQVKKTIEGLDPSLTVEMDKLYDFMYEDEALYKLSNKFSPQLIEAHKNACKDAGFTFLGAQPHRYLNYATPLGTREMVPFELELYYDPDEIGDTEETMAFGVSLSGRYFPTFLDWEDPSGALYHWVMDDVGLKMMKDAKARITEAIWAAADWHFIIQSKFY